MSELGYGWHDAYDSLLFEVVSIFAAHGGCKLMIKPAHLIE